ncbi:MAG: molybdate ABC transporter substrate-binding protein, partial [Acidobacteriota bacterium]
MPKARGWAAALAVSLLGVAGCAAPPEESQETLTIFAAASLRDVITDAADAFALAEGEGAPEVTLNFAGSNVLAQQISAAPAADIFFSADEDWVRFLEAKGRVVPGSVRPSLGNRLVVIARPDAPAAAAPWTGLDRLAGHEVGQLVLADPSAVPAGRYAKAYLEQQAHLEGGGSMWEVVHGRVIPALDVRAALQLVASDPQHVGVVYRTDVRDSDAVEVLYELPDLPSVPIVYYSARVPEGGGDAAAV